MNMPLMHTERQKKPMTTILLHITETVMTMPVLPYIVACICRWD
jgi:hypothetical protein